MVVAPASRSRGEVWRRPRVKLLVVGHEGQLGQALASLVADRPDITLFGLGRAELDLEVSGSAMRAIPPLRPDLVVNCAALTAVDRAELEPERAFRVNAAGAGEIARAARKAGAPMIQISTDYVFDGNAASPYREDAPAYPINVYGRSKLAGEEEVRLAQPDHLILRTAWLFSPFGTNFVKMILRNAGSGSAPAVVDDRYGSPTAAGDVAAGLLAIVDSWRAGGRTFLGEVMHLANGGEASRFTLAHAVFSEAAQLGWPKIVPDPIASIARPGGARRPARSTLDSSKFANAFGFPIAPWQDAVKRVVRTIAASGAISGSIA